MPSAPQLERYGIALLCEGLGDALFAMPVLKKLFNATKDERVYDLFTHHTGLFKACPYIDRVFPLENSDLAQRYLREKKMLSFFELNRLPHWAYDTTDFVSIPAGMDQLSFREKQLEYFPTEADTSQRFDVVLNTSATWPTRSWSLDNWQRLADELIAAGHTVAVVGKDVVSKADGQQKTSAGLRGCTNLVNALSLDQTRYTIAQAGLFVSCQNGLSVLAGTTDVRMVVLDMSIEWSKRALYRQENPLHKFEVVKGDCRIYCCSSDTCPLPENRGVLKCIPAYERVRDAVFARLATHSMR
jgi:ADP-heptose:LPS heptosyltransferase